MAMHTTTSGSDISNQEATETTELDRAIGAAFLSGGIGIFVLGLATVLSEGNASVNQFLVWIKGVGALSGKTSVAIIAFVASWIILHYAFKNRALALMTAFSITIVLVVLGLLLTFPPVFDLLIGK